jgi:galactokinase
VISKRRIEIDGDSGRDTVALRGTNVKPMPRPAIDLFHKTFGAIPRSAASAPGRVNLIGEHTDYNGGPVLPIAIAERTSAAVGPGASSDTGVLEAVSTRFRDVVRIKWQEELPKGWAAYLAGVLRELWALEAVPRDGAVRVAIASDVPVGAGLSSSAALAVATAKALAPSLSARQIAGVAFRAEHDHVGVRCGVMDQTISALGKRDHALLFECASLEATQIPFRARLLLVDTGKRHDLSAGKLNDRRAECEEAVKRLKVELPELVWLASWPAEWLPRLKRALREPLRSRAVHVVSETARTRFAAQLLQQRKLKQFGKLLYESHESCRRLYECSSPELDTVVAAAKRAGALGARLTGAGWGGAAIVLVKERGAGSQESVTEAIRVAFRRAYGQEPPISNVHASAGAHTERV